MAALAIPSMSSGSSSAGSATMFSSLGFLNTARMQLRGGGGAKLSLEFPPPCDDFVEPLAQALSGLESVFGFDWPKQLDDRRCGGF